jgi:hypothetical protein
VHCWGKKVPTIDINNSLVKLRDSNKDSDEEQGERIRVGQGKMKFTERTNCDSRDSSF